ncbi:MAG: DNA adenine methylase [Paludibacteraceae bacterium]|nr:DNA adenine methylase [Paludibacteraceae bacterium]
MLHKTTAINNRRYLGNKYRLLPFIQRVVTEHCENVNVVADLFAGTGAVSSAFQDRQIITNDILYSNYISNTAWFSPMHYDKAKIIRLIEAYNEMNVQEDNYMSNTFADTFFSCEDCRKIGYIREDIENEYMEGTSMHNSMPSYLMK